MLSNGKSMLVVPNYLGKSTISGLGVFAKENVQAGSLMWTFVDNFDLELVADDFPSQVREFIAHYGNMTRHEIYLLCGDNARFMNHSDMPNMSAGGDQNFAMRDISAGEEITCNYREFDIAFKGFKLVSENDIPRHP